MRGSTLSPRGTAQRQHELRSLDLVESPPAVEEGGKLSV
jgi:hypothetical protein